MLCGGQVVPGGGRVGLRLARGRQPRPAEPVGVPLAVYLPTINLTFITNWLTRVAPLVVMLNLLVRNNGNCSVDLV